VSDPSLYDGATRDHEGFWARLARELFDYSFALRQVCSDEHPYSGWFADGNSAFHIPVYTDMYWRVAATRLFSWVTVETNRYRF
jgi:hypothetical protein